jgi:hypothetical protein
LPLLPSSHQILLIEVEAVSETWDILTWLIAKEDFIAFTPHKSQIVCKMSSAQPRRMLHEEEILPY